jgi:protein TonB
MSSLVNLGVWTADRRDSVRRKRLAMGYATGLLVSAGLVAAVIANSKALAAEREEEILDVQLAKEPEPEPQLQPEPARVDKPKPRPRISTPLAVPKEAPKEAEPTGDTKTAADDDPFGQQEEKPPPSKVVAPIAVVAPKPAVRIAPPKPKGPIQITEDVTPPVPIATVAPSYPSTAKANGIEGTVVVKYVVTETGAVTNIQIVRGPAELREAVLSAMRSWRFRPAVFDGRPVAVTRVHRFPFHIKT